jgi:hypothetical protein
MTLEGRKFKMNLAFTDDDTPTKNDLYGVYSTAHRYHLWWAGDTTQAMYRFCPTFMLAGFKQGGTMPRYVIPDEINLYCGTPPAVFEEYIEGTFVCPGGSDIEDALLPAGGRTLLTAFPNPFRGASEIRFAAPGYAALRIFDARGLLIRDFGTVHTGRITWDGRNYSGAPVAPGSYVLRLDAKNESRNLKLTVIR